MWLSDVSVQRPVFAMVISMLLVAFGILSFNYLPLREYPDMNSPTVSIRTGYTGASAEVIETRITQVIEDQISGIEGIKTIRSSSRDENSSIVYPRGHQLRFPHDYHNNHSRELRDSGIPGYLQDSACYSPSSASIFSISILSSTKSSLLSLLRSENNEIKGVSRPSKKFSRNVSLCSR